MPIGPMDDYLAHQTTDTFDHVYSGDRAFYDRYYFNCHSCSDEIFLITGMGQYPNLDVLDAFVALGGEEDGSGSFDADALSDLVQEFGLSVDINVENAADANYNAFSNLITTQPDN